MAEEVATEVTDAKAMTRVLSSGADPALRAERDSPRPRPLWPAPPRPAATPHVTSCTRGRWYRPPDGRIPCCGPGEVPERLLAKESKVEGQETTAALEREWGSFRTSLLQVHVIFPCGKEPRKRAQRIGQGLEGRDCACAVGLTCFQAWAIEAGVGGVAVGVLSLNCPRKPEGSGCQGSWAG